jgi:hypothetical protein
MTYVGSVFVNLSCTWDKVFGCMTVELPDLLMQRNMHRLVSPSSMA